MSSTLNIMRPPVEDIVAFGAKPVDRRKTKKMNQIEGQVSFYDTGAPNVLVYESFCGEPRKSRRGRHVPDGQMLFFDIGLEWTNVIQFPSDKIEPKPEPKKEVSSDAEKKRQVTALIENNTGLIGYCMQQVAGVTTLNVSDVEQAGFIALWKVAEKFDETRGIRFASYATPAIKRAMFREVNRNQDKLSPASLDDLETNSQILTNEAVIIEPVYFEEENSVMNMMFDMADRLRLTKEQKGVKAYAMHIQGHSGAQIADAVGVSVNSYTALISVGRKIVQSHPLFKRAAAEFNNSPQANPTVNLLDSKFELRFADRIIFDVPTRFDEDFEASLINLLSQESVAEHILFETRIGEPVCVINKDTGCTSVLTVQEDSLELTFAVQTSRKMKMSA